MVRSPAGAEGDRLALLLAQVHELHAQLVAQSRQSMPLEALMGRPRSVSAVALHDAVTVGGEERPELGFSFDLAIAPFMEWLRRLISNGADQRSSLAPHEETPAPPSR